jgi:propionyl-CoA carboxylase alpha chain
MASVVPIRRLLIANRGEIARRIMRTAHRMGIATVAAYAEGDVEAPFVREADTAIALGGRTPAETYLDIAKVIAACKRARADAVHPGYGFLSENAAFADAVINSGLIWVGPPPTTIRLIGDKLAAKRLMRNADMPMLEAYEIPDDGNAATVAAKVGYPILIKSAAGGGGRGMRIVETPSDLVQAIASARREAAGAFGNDTVFIERWLPRSRHVEIQILGDQHGNLLHLFERECSIQRRYQKLIEEAPSTALDPQLRERMGQAALTAARTIAYYSAGTVEFLVSGREFFFLEVNTRLQVEHPVTEAVTGLDLVREQLRIAEGEVLGYGQGDVRIDGHAIEARLYAENPSQGFLPAPGTVDIWEPAEGDGVRFDSGIEAGSVIGPEFDPMMAKVIVHAPTRREAAARLARVLEITRIHGLTHNRDFLVATLRTPEFLRGDTTTDFLERVAPAPKRLSEPGELRVAAIGVALHDRAMRRASVGVLQTIPGGFRNSLMPPERVSYRAGDIDLAVAYRVNRNGTFAVEVDGEPCRVVVLGTDIGSIDLEIDGARSTIAVAAIGDRRLVHGPAGDLDLLVRPRFLTARRAESRGGLKAPMPGRVMSLLVTEGDAVERGQLLLVLEAMKMEHPVTAPAAGIIKALKVTEGDQVANGALLVILQDRES